jgi:o-succinylbenzoate synthase
MTPSEPRITAIRWHPYRVPLRQPFATAHGVLAAREGAIIALVTDAGVMGYGDMAAVTEFGGPALPELLPRISTAAQILHGETLAQALSQMQAAVEEQHVPAAILAGFETALLSAQSQTEGITLAQFLAAHQVTPRNRISVNATISARSTVDAVAAAQAAVAAGFTCLKLKVGMAETAASEIERIHAVRAAMGLVPQLRLDANEGWNFEQAQFILSACADCHIHYIEQPLPRDQTGRLRALRAAVTVPIAIDEGIGDYHLAMQAIQDQTADVLILKSSLLGGLYATQHLIELASSDGLTCVITSAIESGIGVTAALHLAAAMPQIGWACGLATLPLLVDDLILEDLPIEQGTMTVPSGPGLGVTPDWEALARYRLEVPGL